MFTKAKAKTNPQIFICNHRVLQGRHRKGRNFTSCLRLSGPFPIPVRRRAEYGFREYGFKHRAQWVFWSSPSSGERAQWVPFSLLFVCQSELTEFFAELTELAVNSVRLSEFSSPKQCSRNSVSTRFLPVIMGCFGARPAFFENGPSKKAHKRPMKRSMKTLQICNRAGLLTPWPNAKNCGKVPPRSQTGKNGRKLPKKWKIGPIFHVLGIFSGQFFPIFDRGDFSTIFPHFFRYFWRSARFPLCSSPARFELQIPFALDLGISLFFGFLRSFLGLACFSLLFQAFQILWGQTDPSLDLFFSRCFLLLSAQTSRRTQIFQKYLSDDFFCIVISFPRAKFVW